MDLKIQDRVEMLLPRLQFAWYAGVQELRNRFRTSVLGGMWLVIGPILLMIVYWVVFDSILRIEFADPASGEMVPFLVAFSVGFFNYVLLSDFLGAGAAWFRSKRRWLIESDTPAWCVYLVLVIRNLVQFSFYLVTVIAIAVGYKVVGMVDVSLFILVSALVFAFMSGIGLIVALMGSFFGDVKETLPVLIRVLFYASSIIFPLSMIPPEYQWIPMVNPLTWCVELSREALLWGHIQIWEKLAGVAVGAAIAWIIALSMYARLYDVLDEVV